MNNGFGVTLTEYVGQRRLDQRRRTVRQQNRDLQLAVTMCAADRR
jgi:hypothetical protein